jgi:chromosomal replication initiation ATPase DnaA
VTPKEKTLADIATVAAPYYYSVEDILGPSRYKRLVYVRRLCVSMLRQKGYSTVEIGRIMNRDHSTICTSLKSGVTYEPSC